MGNIREANKLFWEGDYTSALKIYRDLRIKDPALASVLDFNVKICQKKLDIGSTLSPIKISVKFKIAIVFHVYHQEVTEEILEHLDYIKEKFDIFITTPLNKDSPAIKIIFDKYPDSRYFKMENKGRDILPFLNIFNEVRSYDLCLKIHTKQGLTNYGDLWRKITLQSLLKNEEYVFDLITAFKLDPKIVIAGPKDFYVSGRRMMYENLDNLLRTCTELGIDYKQEDDWAFFAGTMFWFRPRIYVDHSSKLKGMNFESEKGRQDGGIEHAIERILGLIPSLTREKALLLSGFGDANIKETVAMPDKTGTSDPTKHIFEISKKILNDNLIYGDVNLQSSSSITDMKVRGWIYRKGEKYPRNYILKIGGLDFEGSAGMYRADLELAKIHEGFHAFEVKVPLSLANSKKHNVTLFDKEFGLPLASSHYKWNPISRPYSNFSEYLSWSHSGQLIPAPFVEEDKRAFAVMEIIADHLSNSMNNISHDLLVSIIMPTYNRASFIGMAIQSVIDQSYKNWELIIVDDGSMDNTSAIVAKYNDRRIKYVKTSTNAGVSSARNLALDMASGDYIAYLDSDNEWDLRYLSAMIGVVKFKLPDIDVFYCGQILFEGVEKKLTGVRFGLFNKTLLLNNNYIDLNCFFHKRRLSLGIPKFDINLKRYVDWDFIINISLSEKIVAVPVILSKYYLAGADNTLTANGSLSDNILDIRRKIASHVSSRDLFAVPRAGLFNGISIVIPSFEAKDSIEHCIQSIEPYFKIDGFFDIELIIVDNKSSSNVLEFLREYANMWVGRVKLIELNKNFGFTYAVNRGIAAAKGGNDLLILNNDAVLAGDALFQLQRVLYKFSEYGLAVPAQILRGGTETINIHVPYALPEYDTDVNISVHHKNFSNPPLFWGEEHHNIDFAPFFCVLIKASTLVKLPLLDEVNGRHYRSDRTYCDLVRNYLGLDIAYCPNAIVYHGLQKSTSDLKEKKDVDSEYENIFLTNTWSSNDLHSMGVNLPAWNAVN